MSSLYELTHDFIQVQSMIEEGHEGLKDTLESIDLAIEDKLENIGKLIRNLDGEMEMLKNEESRLANKRRSLEANKKRLKVYVEDQLTLIGKDKVKAGLFTFAMQNNAPSVRVLDEKLLPKRFFIEQEPKLDKKTLREELKNIGKDSMPGVELVQGRSLRIR
ncbi:siphovirus Gp157 family protein [Virgibacillus salexigens]|uniref:siphovirus Gp157 family protein n=1 Tax=Virgibacillus salexigens TaxID=61016 RepID=UPI003081860F